MSKADSALRRLERQWARRNLGRVLRIKILSYGAPSDSLYHEGGRTYTEDELTTLEAEYQLIIVCYGDRPTGDGEVIQMTWGNEE